MSDVLWLTAFLDLTDSSFAGGVGFWRAVTGSDLSSFRGERQEFATLLPPDGDPFLRVQRVAAGPGGTHLDLHTEDPVGLGARAVAAGATLVDDTCGYLVLDSPGGLAFCLVPPQDGAVRPSPVRSPDGRRSLVDQVCLDIPPAAFDGEVSFWAELTGWERRAGARPEFYYLVRPEGVPLRVLCQRLDHADFATPVRAHLDLACDDVEAEVRRHEGLGAMVVRRTSYWVTMRDPLGREYCLTGRDPNTGLLSR